MGKRNRMEPNGTTLDKNLGPKPFIQDNNPEHIAATTTEWFKSKILHVLFKPQTLIWSGIRNKLFN